MTSVNPTQDYSQNCIDAQFAEYITNRKWAVDQKSARKLYLFQLAQQSREGPDFAAKIGGILIYNQVIEQFLADIVEMSLYYIKAKIWPVRIDLDVELDKATFGKVIEYFRQFGTIESNRDEILTYLKKFNSKRNQVAHDLFDVDDLDGLALELDEYAELAEQIVWLLDEYDDQVCRNFCELEKRTDFSKFFK